MNRNNSKSILEKKRLEQKEFMLKLQREIIDLEEKIKHARFDNLKIDSIRNLKISLRVLQLIAPYVTSAGLVAGVFALFGDIPFYPYDEWKIYSYVMTEFDNMGHIRTERQYKKFDNSANMLYYFSKWQLEKLGGGYSRITQTYDIDKETYESITKLFNEKDLNLEEVLGSPKTNIKETNNNLTREEIEQDTLIKAVIYNKDTDDYIIHKETFWENFWLSVAYSVIILFLNNFLHSFRKEVLSFDFSSCIKKINEKHPHINIEELQKKLELRKENYNRLLR